MGARSFLFVPGDQPDKLAKADQRGSDALILDLEDAVTPSAKVAARDAVADWLDEGGRSADVWVRVNNQPDLLTADVEAVAVPGIAGVVVPKLRSAKEAADIAAMLAAAEARHGVDEGTMRIVALIETPHAVLDVVAIAAVGSVTHLMAGEMDLGVELGILPSADDREFAPLRMQLVVASAAAGIEPPIGSVSPDFRDAARFYESTVALRRMGFGSRPAIHPNQVPTINRVFTPSDGEIEAARRLIDRHETEAVAGRGVFLDEHGRMVDEPVIRAARRVIETADRTDRSA